MMIDWYYSPEKCFSGFMRLSGTVGDLY